MKILQALRKVTHDMFGPKVAQYSIPIEDMNQQERSELSRKLRHIPGLQFWWLSDTELTLVFELEAAESGVMMCRSLVNGNSPLTIR